MGFFTVRGVGLSMLILSAATACVGGKSAQSNAPSTSASEPPAIVHSERVFPGGVPPPGADPHNPYAGDKKAADEGAVLFTSMHCDGCHGAPPTGWVGPSLIARRWRFGGSDADVYQSIFYGRPHGMPAFGGLLGTDGVWKIETYLRSLPAPNDVPTESWQ